MADSSVPRDTSEPSQPSQTAEKDWLALPRALKAPLYDYLGFDITDGGEGWAEVTLQIRDVLLNADGVLHGGVWTVVADTAMGAAARTLIEPHERVITTQSDFRWLRAIKGDRLISTGRVLRRGRTGWHCTVECHDQTGTLVGQGSGSFVVIER